jgi:hypothetical protein
VAIGDELHCICTAHPPFHCCETNRPARVASSSRQLLSNWGKGGGGALVEITACIDGAGAEAPFFFLFNFLVVFGEWS